MKYTLGSVIFALALGFAGLPAGTLGAHEVNASNNVALSVRVGPRAGGYYYGGHRNYRHRRYPYNYRYYNHPRYRYRYHRYPYHRYHYYNPYWYWYDGGGSVQFYLGD